MANAATSNVTTVYSATFGALNSKRFVKKLVRLTGGTFGGGTNKIVASAFQLSRLVECSNATTSNDAKTYVAQVAYGGGHILLTDPTTATDASRVPADVNLASETLEFTITGIE